jgi:hypothetical protein
MNFSTSVAMNLAFLGEKTLFWRSTPQDIEINIIIRTPREQAC